MTQTAYDIKYKVSPYFEHQPVNAAYLFGSFSRGEEKKDSDVDIIVVLDKSQHVGLFKLSQMNIDLENILKRRVYLVSDGSLKSYVTTDVDKDKILIYERTRS